MDNTVQSYSSEQQDELLKLNFEYEKISLVRAILEARYGVKQLTELLNAKPDQEEPKTKRIKEEY